MKHMMEAAEFERYENKVDTLGLDAAWGRIIAWNGS